MFAIVAGLLSSVSLGQCRIDTLVSPSPTADRFGDRLAMNDRHLIVLDTRDTGSDGVFAYHRATSGDWEYLGPIVAPGNISNVALHHNSLIITTLFSTMCSGSTGVHTFEFTDGSWSEAAPLCNPMVSPYGADLHTNLALLNSGSSVVAVHRRIDGEWVFSDLLSNPDSPAVASAFGSAMAVDDRTVFIGAYFERVPAGPGGAVYVYRRLPGDELELAQKLVAPDVLRAPAFGNSIAVAGDTLVVGGYLSRRTYEDQGAVYVYRLIDGQWQLEQELTHSNPGENDHFGIAVATDGQRIVASARYADTRFRSAGRVYVFERDGSGAWVQTQDFDHHEPSYGYGTVLGLGAGVVATGPGSGYVDLVDLALDCCRPDLDGDGALTIFDYLAFQTLFDAGDALADFDDDGALTIFDFLVFQSDFVDGCD
jgi:hypothetical protein